MAGPLIGMEPMAELAGPVGAEPGPLDTEPGDLETDEPTLPDRFN